MRKCLPTALNIGHSIESSVRQAALFLSLVTPCLDFQVYRVYTHIYWIVVGSMANKLYRWGWVWICWRDGRGCFQFWNRRSNPHRGWNTSRREKMIGYCKFDVILGLKLRRGLRGHWNFHPWENRVRYFCFPYFLFTIPPRCWRTSLNIVLQRRFYWKCWEMIFLVFSFIEKFIDILFSFWSMWILINFMQHSIILWKVYI